MLAAFEASGLAESHIDWIIENWVSDPATAQVDPADVCAGARPAEIHSHFFTAYGRFGSRDANGKQVDEGDFAVVDGDTLSFPSHAAEFGYHGDILVDYQVDGDSATFEVTVPSECLASCLDAYAWALSAFFAAAPWTRSG